MELANLSIPMLNVKTAKGNKLINPLEILYIEAKNRHSFIYLTDLTYIDTHHLLKWYEAKLTEPQFCRCHKSFIVNCLHIDCTSGNSIIMKKGNLHIPVSRDKKRYYKDNLELFYQMRVSHSIQNNDVHVDVMTVTPK